MDRALSLFLILLGCAGWASGLCTLENGTTASCHELEDVKYIETYDLESLKASLEKPILHSGLFANLTSLRHLDLSGGAIERIEPGSFGQLANLRSLNLAKNRIEHLELDAVSGLPHLHSLNLRENRLSHLPAALARLRLLKHLDVQGNPLQCDCATLRVRDLIVKRGVKISKRVHCAGPSAAKGSSLLQLDATTICRFEEQDLEMQNDQADPEDEYGSGDLFDKDSGEHVEMPDVSPETPKESEVETPYPAMPEASTTAWTIVPSPDDSIQKSVSPDEMPAVSTQKIDSVMTTSSQEEEIFFDSEEKRGRASTAETTTERKKLYKDALFYPVEGSGDEEEGSGEGSGAGTIFGNWQKVGEVERTTAREEDTSGNGWFDMLFNMWWSTTEAPTVSSDPDLEEEQFIDASPSKGVDEEVSVPRKAVSIEEVPTTAETVTRAGTIVPTAGVVLVEDELHDMTKLEKVKVEETMNDELAEVSPAKQSKKGMGSYVVLAALLAILATLIGFAAYKGDFCKRKRKRGDVEHGTEMKDMQKSLLDTGNQTQPKVASNGNVESAPLVVDAVDREESKPSEDRPDAADAPMSLNGISGRAEVAKPPRSSVSQNDQKTKEPTGPERSSLKEDSLSARTSSMDAALDSGPVSRLSEVDGPPLSPGAQRVRITLQENPDSVPRTPILITRTMAGENLVKMP